MNFEPTKAYSLYVWCGYIIIIIIIIIGGCYE